MAYGKNQKRISFMDTDKRIAELQIRLKHDGLTKTKFFRTVLTGYLERDPVLIDFLDTYAESISTESKTNRKKAKTLQNQGAKNKIKFGLNEGEIEDIFDMLEKEHPDL